MVNILPNPKGSMPSSNPLYSSTAPSDRRKIMKLKHKSGRKCTKSNEKNKKEINTENSYFKKIFQYVRNKSPLPCSAVDCSEHYLEIHERWWASRSKEIIMSVHQNYTSLTLEKQRRRKLLFPGLNFFLISKNLDVEKRRSLLVGLCPTKLTKL